MLQNNQIWNRIQRLDRIRHELEVMEPTSRPRANNLIEKAATAIREAISVLASREPQD